METPDEGGGGRGGVGGSKVVKEGLKSRFGGLQRSEKEETRGRAGENKIRKALSNIFMSDFGLAGVELF